MIGTIISNYKIISVLGEGGMGTVYLAEHTVFSRKVAVKVLLSQYIKNSNLRERFKNESILLSKLKHPYIVGVYDFYEDENGLYIFMEYIEGTPLDEYIEKKSGPISSERAIPIMKKVLDAFSYAHSQGIIHRDIKPSNIMIDDNDDIKVLDFGIAKILDDDKSLTKTGQMGTVFYMSPEQVKGDKVTEKSDIYSLGVTFYQILTGLNPYGGLTTEFEIFNKITQESLPNPQSVYPGIPYFLCSVLEKSLQKEPVDRFSTCQEFINAINNEEELIIEIKPIIIKKNKKPLVIGLIIGLLIAISIVGLIVFTSGPNKTVIKINFISDHSIAQENSSLPSEIITFASIFENVEENAYFLPVLSFERLDLDYPADTIPFTRSVYNDIDIEAAKKMYEDERQTIPSMYSMYAPSNLAENKSINESVNNVRYFYLDKSKRGKFDGRLYFNDENLLREYINVQLANQTLFLSGQKQNVINIIIIDNNDDVDQKKDEHLPFDNKKEIEGPFNEIDEKVDQEVLPEEVKVGKVNVKTYNANLVSNGNQISWNSELTNAQSLIISFKSLEDGNVLVEENVKGQSGYYFTYSNSIYTDSRIKVELKAVFSDNSKIKNQSITVNNLTCH